MVHSECNLPSLRVYTQEHRKLAIMREVEKPAGSKWTRLGWNCS